jgi:hypothetical protein
MRIHGIIVSILLTLGGASAAFACSQCMCGTPFPSDALGGVVPMEYRFGLEERFLSKSNGLEGGELGEEEEQEHHVSGFGVWRPTNRLALLGRVPYVVKEITESPLGGAETVGRASGLGDIGATALVGLARLRTTGSLALVLGVTAPTGDNNVSENGERLDAHLQPGIGAWSGSTGFNFSLPLARGTFEVSTLGRWSGTNDHGYRYGNVALYNLGYTSPERGGFALLAQINGRSADRDRFEDGTMGEHTGGTVIYASPGVRWFAPNGVSIEAAVQIPFVENLYGIQDEHTTARFALSYGR